MEKLYRIYGEKVAEKVDLENDWSGKFRIRRSVRNCYPEDSVVIINETPVS